MYSCWVIYNGSLTNDKFRDQAVLIKEAAERAGVHTEIKKNYEVMMDLESTIETRPDFVVFLDKDILLAKFLKMLAFQYLMILTLLKHVTIKQNNI